MFFVLVRVDQSPDIISSLNIALGSEVFHPCLSMRSHLERKVNV